MIGIQILALLFAGWMMYFTYLHFRRKEFGKIEALLWSALWVGLVIVVIWPTSVNFILSTFSISRTFDLVVVVAIMVLFGVTFRNYVLTKRLRKKLEDLSRYEAIRKANKRDV